MAKSSRPHPGLKTPVGKVSRTEQSHKDACDINNIMKNYHRTGLAVQRVGEGMMYGDFTDVIDYQTSIERIRAAQEDFDSLPSMVRKRFNNDPAQLIQFVSDERNVEEAIKLGLIPFKASAEPVKPPAEPAKVDVKEPVAAKAS